MSGSRYKDLDVKALRQVIGWKEQELRTQKEQLTDLRIELAKRTLRQTAELSDVGLSLYIDCLDPETVKEHKELLLKTAWRLTKKELSRRKCEDDNNLLGTCIHAPEDTQHTQCLLCGEPLEAE